MNIRLNLFCGALSFWLAAVSSAETPANLSEAEVRRFVEPLITAGRTEAISVAVVTNGATRVIHMGDAGNQIGCPDDRTVYEIGSITKVFTGILLAGLVVDEKINLSDAAVVEGSPIELPSAGGQPIRWVDLSTHRSGLPRLPSNFQPNDHRDPYAAYDTARAAEFLQTLGSPKPPGSSDEYSNIAVSILGRLIADVAGKPYSDLLRDRVTATLAMNDTSIELTSSMQQRFAQPYQFKGVPNSPWTFADLPAAGGIRSTLADMIRFAQAQLHPPENDLGKAIEVAWSRQAEPIGGGFANGLGWMIARDGNTHWHNGGTGGFRSSIFVNRQLDCAVIVLANTADAPVDPLAERLVQRLAGLDVQPQQFDTDFKVPLEEMERLEGRYQLAPTFIFTVRVAGDRLLIEITDQPTQQVYAKANDVWFYKSVDAELHFDLPERGKSRSLSLHQDGLVQSAKRVADRSSSK